MTNNPQKKETELDDIALMLLKRIRHEAQDVWADPSSKYREFRNLQIDKRGSFGERFFASVLTNIYIRRLKVEYNDGDQGDWDLKFNNVKFEIKTSSLDVNSRFQNEGLKDNGDYQGVMFLGISPDQLYVKFMLKEDIPFKRLHNRESAKTGKGYKMDFKMSDMIPVFTTEDIKTEFEKNFGDLTNLKSSPKPPAPATQLNQKINKNIPQL